MLIYLFYLHVKRHPDTSWPAPEEFVNLQDLLVKVQVVWHQYSTVQFSRHQFVRNVRSVQFGAPGQVPPFSSFSSVHEVFRPCTAPMTHTLLFIKLAHLETTTRSGWLVLNDIRVRSSRFYFLKMFAGKVKPQILSLIFLAS